MNAVDAVRTEPGVLRAGILAVLVHVSFIALMVFGLNWKAQPPEGMVVELWQDLPQPTEPQEVPEPSPPPPPVKEQTKPEKEPVQEPVQEPVKEPVEQQPTPESISVAPSPPKKPDIPLKQKREKPEPPETVKEIKPDPEELEKQAQERIAAENQAKEKAEAERLRREKEAEQAAQAQREAQQAAARARVMNEVAKYKAMILAKIRSRIVMPPDLPGNPVTEFNVTLLPGGDILHVRLHRSSGYAAFDSAVERAIYLSKPLPLPPDPALFNEFRNLNVTVHYLE